MATVTRRPRSSTSTSLSSATATLVAELQPLIESTSRTEPIARSSQSAPEQLNSRSTNLHRIRQIIVEAVPSSQAQDAFRHLHGFQAVIHCLRTLSGFYNSLTISTDAQKGFFGLLEAICATLNQALYEHKGNRRYFKKRVYGGGWQAFEQALASTGVGGGLSEESNDSYGQQRLFGCLISFAFADDTMVTLFQRILGHAAPTNRALKSPTPTGGTGTKEGEDSLPMVSISTSSSDDSPEIPTLIGGIETQLQTSLPGSEHLSNPEAVSIIVNFWLALPRKSAQETSSDPTSRAMSICVILVLQRLAAVSKHNLAAFHSSGALSTLIPRLSTTVEGFSNIEKQLLEKFARQLVVLGVNCLEDARYLFRESIQSPTISEFLLQAIRSSRDPPYIHFDLSIRGFSSIELPTLGRPFPPTSPSAGYTLSSWLKIEKFDDHSHITIFGAFDSAQICFVLAYIEKDTHNFILQTSVTSKRPSVRFKSTIFQEGKWYHISVVHRRPRTTSSSKASLYVNGEFVEQVKCQYPESPPAVNSITDGFTPFISSKRQGSIQAFLGTPHNLSSKLGKGFDSTRWSLGSAHLFDEVLTDDLIAVHYHLGPRYHGNFQDCLGSFQTYEASAALNMRNEFMHPGKEEKSDIVAAIRFKASALLPESRIIFSVSPLAVMDDDDGNNVDESELIKSLSKHASKNLEHLTRTGGNAIAINGAVPAINDALTQPHGVAYLTGDPIVIVPQALDDASWQIGGCAAVTLRLVEVAQTQEDVVRAVEILLESIKGNWRNSETMERENGFGVLGSILRDKLGISSSGSDSISGPIHGGPAECEKLSFELLSAILGFVGYSHERPEESIIINPLAYRILLVDFDMWRKAGLMTQRLYYRQFVVFGVLSKHHHFNAKRLIRMRAVKKLLEALKGETFAAEIFPGFIEAFRSLVTSNLSPETLRSVSLFITYALHTQRQPMSAHPLRIKNSIRQIRQRHSPSPNRPASANGLHPNRSPLSPLISLKDLSRFEIGVKVLEMYSSILCEPQNTANIKKFARAVTNKWLLYLLAENDPRVVGLAAKIMARVLVIHGAGYVNKFAEKTGGFVVMRYRLKRWWHLPIIWPVTFAILFGRDVAEIDFDRDFDLFGLLETFLKDQKARIVYPDILPVITTMLQSGVKTVVGAERKPVSGGKSGQLHPGHDRPTHVRKRSMSLNTDLSPNKAQDPPQQNIEESAELLHTVCRFLADAQSTSQDFRDFAVSSNYVRELLACLFPIIVSSDSVSPEAELNTRNSSLTFGGEDVVIRPLSRASTGAPPIVRTTIVETSQTLSSQRARPIRQGSSYILVTSDQSQYSPSSARLKPIMSPKTAGSTSINVGNSLVQELLEIVIAIFTDQLLQRKEFPGFGLYLKVPPGFQEHQAYFRSYILRNTLSDLGNTVQLNLKLLWEPRVLTNMARFATHIGEAVFEGWFLDGAMPLLAFAGNVLDYLQGPDVAQIKSVRLCHQAISTIRSVFLRTILLQLSDLDDSEETKVVTFLGKITYWQTIILSPDDGDENTNFLRLICYLLYTKLISSQQKVRLAAANLWRIILVQKPTETSTFFNSGTTGRKWTFVKDFTRLVEMDTENFIDWVDEHRGDLDAFFLGDMSKAWEAYVIAENRKIEESARSRIEKRAERLKQWLTSDLHDEDVIRRHEAAAIHWVANIHSSEQLKYQRAVQDNQDNLTFLSSTYRGLEKTMLQPCGVFESKIPLKWELDQTEGRNRMRSRLLPSDHIQDENYQPKAHQIEKAMKSLKVDTTASSLTGDFAITATPAVIRTNAAEDGLDNVIPKDGAETPLNGDEREEGFEIVDDPHDNEDDFEDRNRKVMRSLQRGDQVQHVYNVSRIVGLEACEGLLILGKNYLYLIDNYFQRTDGEIVNVWQAPMEERDPYLQMIAGRESKTRGPRLDDEQHDSRNWHWTDVISISKRRFLFRDVAIEIFFIDGRSYLLTASSPQVQTELHTKLMIKAPHISGTSISPHPEEAWRLEALKSPDDAPQSFGSKFASVFNTGISNPATRRWVKGEISNFHYLMLINTMAGRTFNDLTQYPVFPWVLADYTSDELDLTNPRSYRDLTKPMGCQNPARQIEYQERYRAFADMGDQPPFHYGTHYSSAMIVTSYLIRLQPFVQSYLLLQGGNFDHPDRLFYSVQKAWMSASRDNMTDVRELIPEFFYLPEFLMNTNGYNFGRRQGAGETIDNVALPPWAKGDPKIFVAKHREALESPFVSKNLHHWIDLIFGFKQRGEAAVEATNVFHHLSYHGAKDLDSIEDPVERLATIGIIHNFGQTPHQIFHRSHPPRTEVHPRTKRLDIGAESLTRIPHPLLESGEAVASLLHFAKQDRLLCSGAFRINIPPNYDKYMEWGFIDGSIRFYAADSRKLIGLFEHLHQGQLSTALFADSRTLITAGTDATISVWTLSAGSKSIDLQLKSSLFGHKSAVTRLAISRSFSTFLSASADGEILLWDLNRLALVRRLVSGHPVECASINDNNGMIMLGKGSRLALYTLNGQLLVNQIVCDLTDDYVVSCAFYESEGAEWLEKNLVFTGHKRGVVKVWSLVIESGQFRLQLLKQLNHIDPQRDGANVVAAITCILPLNSIVYTGDADGRVVEWDVLKQ